MDFCYKATEMTISVCCSSELADKCLFKGFKVFFDARTVCCECSHESEQSRMCWKRAGAFGGHCSITTQPFYYLSLLGKVIIIPPDPCLTRGLCILEERRGS